MPILSLCSGYGGLDMAVEALTGDKVAYVAESDEVASLVLAHHWPDVPNIGDISTYDFARLRGEVDAIAAGFPCQPTSNAGRRLGVLDERWLWPHVARAVRDIRPGYVFLENVDAIRHRNRGLGVVLADLAEIGYDAWWVCLPASVVGAAHIRWRWFAVAIPADAGRQGLATGHVEAGDRRAALERGGLVPQDPHGSARNERLSSAPRKASGGGHGPTLDDEVSFLLPHAQGIGRPQRGAEPAQQQGEVRRVAGDGGHPAPDTDGIGRNGRAGDKPEESGRDEPANRRHSPAGWWGEYLPAVRRWENRIEVPAPAPTEIGPRGGRRLAASFAEWLMGIPGHVTGVPGLTRAQQLHKIGNGAMPQQAYVAYEYLLRQIQQGER